MTVPEDLATELRSVTQQLDQLDTERDALVQQRDALIVRARAAGGSLRELAEIVGLGHMTVKRIAEQRDTG
jgi:DNA invertase Pin-like site-specific DNA recombinase